MPDFTCLDENLFAKVAQTLLQHISSTHCNFKSALGPSILLLCVRLADVQMNGFINYCEKKLQEIARSELIPQVKINVKPSNK